MVDATADEPKIPGINVTQAFLVEYMHQHQIGLYVGTFIPRMT